MTVITNNTNKTLNMRVGNQSHFLDFTSLPSGKEHIMRIDYSDTYHEYLIKADNQGQPLIVTSDDCCDNKRITITEVDGCIRAQHTPRRQLKPAPAQQIVVRPAKKLKLSRLPSGRMAPSRLPSRVPSGRAQPPKKLGLFRWGLMCQ